MDHGLLTHSSFQFENGHQNSTQTQITSPFPPFGYAFKELPTEYYDLKILKTIGQMIGEIIKIDSCTTHTTKGDTMHVCVF